MLNQVEMGKIIGGEAAEILVVKKTGSLFQGDPVSWHYQCYPIFDNPLLYLG